jgi:hypothetical protein
LSKGRTSILKGKFEHRGLTCRHVYAASIARAKITPCSGCGARLGHRELYEVDEDNLTPFPDELLWRTCALAYRVL